MNDFFESHWVLSVLLILPLAGSAACLIVREEQSRHVAMLTSVVAFLVSLPLFWTFRSGTAAIQNYISIPWIEAWGIGYTIGIDGISILMVLLTTFVTPLAILGSEVPFPFQARPSQILVPGIPAGVIAAMPLLDDWGVPSRLASLQGYPGCFEGYVTELARVWLASLDAAALAEVEVFACGPHPMLEAVAALARGLGLPCQVSLEEIMACAVGGCAGCVVEVKTPEGPAMKRVCVDGPVFEAGQVF